MVQEGGREGDECSLIAEKDCWGCNALLQLLCSIEAMQYVGGTQAPNLSSTQSIVDMKKQAWAVESQLPFPCLHYGR